MSPKKLQQPLKLSPLILESLGNFNNTTRIPAIWGLILEVPFTLNDYMHGRDSKVSHLTEGEEYIKIFISV
jgi:hypothetical protein